MKRIIFVSFLTWMLLSGCERIERQNIVELSQATNPVVAPTQEGIKKLKVINGQVKKKEIDNENGIKDFINHYEGSLSQALSLGDFSLIKNIIKPDSKLFDALRLMIQYYSNENIQQRLVFYEIHQIQKLEGEGKYRVNLYEKLDIKYPGTFFYVYDFYWTLDLEKKENVFRIADVVEWSEGKDIYEGLEKRSQKSLIEEDVKDVEIKRNKRLPKTLPKDLKEEKICMTKAAMDAVTQYIQVDYKDLELEDKVRGFGFAQGNGLLNLFKDYKEMISTIKEKKIRRRVSMVEMKYQEYYEELGFVDIVIKYSNEEGSMENEVKKQVRINLVNVGNCTWYIQGIENLKIN